MPPRIAELLETVELPKSLRVDAAEAVAVARRIHRRIADRGVDVPLTLWDGTMLGPADATFRVVVHHPWSLRAMLLPGTDLATGEAFVFDAFDVEGSMVDALAAVARIAEQDTPVRDRVAAMGDLLRLPRPPPRVTWRRAALDGDVHTRERDAEAVRFHYDVGNDFYRLFLDTGLVYSCAYFEDLDGPVEPDGDELDRAQGRKLDLVCRKLGLTPGRRLLDIGCGWGSLVLHAAEHFGVSAVGVTLSAEQATLARERVARAGLGDRVEIRVQDYREVAGSFDAVASVGMVEHVGAAHLQEYCDTIASLMSPGGRFLNHGITTGQRNAVRDMNAAEDSFVARYVFPDGALVPAWRMTMHMQQAGLEIHDLEQLRPHYARTLRYWVSRLEARADEARQLAGDVTYRIWRAYMAGSVVGFECGDLGVIQLLGSKAGDRPVVLPAGRAWMQPSDPAASWRA